MSKKLTVVLLTPLGTAEKTYQAGDDYVCASAEQRATLIERGLAVANAKDLKGSAGRVTFVPEQQTDLVDQAESDEAAPESDSSEQGE